MPHTWPKPLRPISKSNRTCITCGLTAFATKHKHTERVDYQWVIGWQRGDQNGIVDGLRQLPACVPAVPADTEGTDHNA